jgi:hypothetical protein
MATQRGQDGLLILGGEVVGSPLARTVYATSVTVIAVTGGGSTLTGVLMVGDIFSIAGGTSYTVTTSAIVAGTNAFSNIAFTPAIATAIASSAAVSFQTHSVAELKAWTLDSLIETVEDTVKGDKHKTYVGALAGHSGTASALLDGADTYQAALLNKIATASPDGTTAALAFRIASGKLLYGAAVLSNFAIASPEGSALVTINFSFQINGRLTLEYH